MSGGVSAAPWTASVHGYRPGMALRIPFLYARGDSRPGIEPTGRATRFWWGVGHGMNGDPGTTTHPFVFTPLNSMSIRFILARWLPFCGSAPPASSAIVLQRETRRACGRRPVRSIGW
jgi:hypothetical protein